VGYSARGLALAQLKDRTADAKIDLDRALALADDFRHARLHRAVFYHNQKKYKEAEADFAAVLAPPAEKRIAEVHFTRTDVYDVRCLIEALFDFEAIAASPRPVQATYLHLNRLYLIKSDAKRPWRISPLFLNRSKDFRPRKPACL